MLNQFNWDQFTGGLCIFVFVFLCISHLTHRNVMIDILEPPFKNKAHMLGLLKFKLNTLLIYIGSKCSKSEMRETYQH